MSTLAKVLIVEDEILIAKVMQIEMIAKGYHVLGIAATIERAHEFVACERPDIVTLDFNLSGKTTENFARFLKRKNIPFVVASANPYLAIAAIGFEPDGYVAKPFTSTNVTDCLRSSLKASSIEGNVTRDIAESTLPLSVNYSS